MDSSKKAKIYKLFCDDGYFYYGSTYDTLTKRMYQHIHSSKTLNKNFHSKLQSHINKIGRDRIKIILVEEFPYTTRDEMRKKENEYIVRDLDNSLCLNVNRSYASTSFSLEM